MGRKMIFLLMYLINTTFQMLLQPKDIALQMNNVTI